MYYWDGRAWVSALSPDGCHRWDGAAWVPVSAAVHPTGAAQAVRREPTSWTRPLQIAVIGWYAFSAVYTATTPFWTGGAMHDVMSQVIRRQEATSAEPLPPGFAETMTAMMTTIFWAAAIFGIAISAVAIAGALRRWTWTYYAVVVLLGLGVLGLPINIANAGAAGVIDSAEGFTLPAWTAWLGIATGVAGGALFVWMLVALVKRGPWGMRRVS